MNELTIKRSLELEKFGKVKYDGKNVLIMKYDEPSLHSELTVNLYNHFYGSKSSSISTKAVIPRVLLLLCNISRTSANKYDVFLYTPQYRGFKTLKSMSEIVQFMKDTQELSRIKKPNRIRK